jgi:hypothetical protein
VPLAILEASVRAGAVSSASDTRLMGGQQGIAVCTYLCMDVGREWIWVDAIGSRLRSGDQPGKVYTGIDEPAGGTARGQRRTG